VFARQQKATTPWYYIASGTWNHAALQPSALETVASESYKIALQFGDLILVVVHWPLQRWYLRVEKGELKKLWPETAVVKEYVHPEPQDISASDAACRRLVLSVSVVPRNDAEGRGG